MIHRLALLAGVSLAAESEYVKKLTSENFEPTIKENKYVLVKFFAPWCGHCKAMAADYEKAAEQLATDGSEAIIAEVDATVETGVATQYEVQGYPMLYWFVSGNKREYSGPRSADGIVEWVKTNMGPVLKEWTTAELNSAKEERAMGDAIFTFSGSKTKSVAEEIAETGKAMGTVAFMTDVKKDAITVYRGGDESVSYSGKYETEAVTNWMVAERSPYFGQINEDNFEIYVEQAKKGLFWVCLDPATREADLKEWTSDIVAAAKAQKKGSNYPFVWLDISEFEAHAKEELGCSNFPTIVLQKGDLLGDREDTKVDKYVRSFADERASFGKAAIAQFFADVESGKLGAMPEPDELSDLDEEEDDEGDLDDEGLDDNLEDKEEL